VDSGVDPMTSPPLACTVRDCGLLLESRERVFICARNHSYDVARSGYINLLQPHDRRSLRAGDAKEAIAARSRLLAAGIGTHVVEGVVACVARLNLPDDAVVADLGSGGGEVMGALAATGRITAIGVDLSTAAADRAARAFPQVTWVVANADRRLPFVDRTVDVIVSLHGRRSPRECARVLSRPGRLVVGVPAPDDLIELRESVQGRASEDDRSDAVLIEHEPHFSLVERLTLRDRQRLEREALLDLLQGTYRGARRSTNTRTATLAALDVTLATDVLVFAVR
jgi:23S rRNA (guanine745-N1)-methyltransferase